MKRCLTAQDEWINGLMDEWIGDAVRLSKNPFIHQSNNPVFCLFMEYTKRRNLNRGYMKLDVWQRGLDLFALAFQLSDRVSDFKLKSQFRDAAQSVSANITE